MASAVTNGQLLADLTERCRLAQRRWAQTPLRKRLQPVQQFRFLLASEHARLCEAVRQDIDKPPEETLACELLPLAEACRFLVREARGILRPRRVPLLQRPYWLWGQHDEVHRRPRGLIGIIGTWNYPLLLNGVQILQALAAGNGVLWKPSEQAVASADVLGSLLHEAGFPEGLIHRLPATREAGRQLAEADVDHIVFTGHVETGRALATTLGRRLVSSTLELSGHDLLVLLADADVSLAARAAWFAVTLNRGQTCLAVRRVLVPRSLYAPFLDPISRLAVKAAPVRLVTPAQGSAVEPLIQEALAHGARLLVPVSGSLPLGWFQPNVLADVRPDLAICREPIFVPLLAVLPYDRLEEVLEAEERCPFALGASIFTQNPSRGVRLAAQLRAGVVSINDVISATAHPATPLAAQKASGWGITQGAEGLLEMTVPQVVNVRYGRSRPHYEPLAPQRALLEAALQADHAATWGQRARALFAMLRNLLGGS